MAELLSICIPTYNRCNYLSELLESITLQITQNPKTLDKVRIYISDNASTDATRDVCENFDKRLHRLEYSPNERNIGADPNILRCCGMGQGEYRWVMGDDELMAPGGLAHVIEVLETQKPGLLINNDGKYPTKLRLPATYDNFRAFANATVKAKNPNMLLAQTLITCNVFLSTCFDTATAKAMLSTRYAHMYGLVAGLHKMNKSIYVSKHKTIIVREKRAPVALAPRVNLEKHWAEYIQWIKETVDVPGINVTEALIVPTDLRIKCSTYLYVLYVKCAPFIPSRIRALIESTIPSQ